MLLQQPHDLNKLVAALPQDRRVQQAAFDVQFEYAYVAEEDTNYAYPEDLSVLAALVKAGAKPEFRHLLAAAQQGKMKTVRYLLGCGVLVQSEADEESPLSGVAYWGDAALLKQMIAAGADVNFARPADGWTPLLAGAWSGQEECVKVLLDNGADVNVLYTVWVGNRQPIWKVVEERASKAPPGDSLVQVWQLVAAHKTNCEKDAAQPANGKPQPEPEGGSR